VRVPREAVLDVRGLTTVFVGQGELGSFVARTVVIQAEAGTDVLLESGVNIGEQVVVRGMIYLKGEMLRDSLGGE
jgi:multidrug efflux pump subunit AcrA (membrane-fusion protein)